MAYPSQQWRCRTCRTTCNSIDAIALRCFACQAATVVSATWATKCSHRKLKANFQVPNQWWVMSCLMPGYHKLPSHESYTWLQTLYLDIWDPTEGNQAPCRLISVKRLWHLSYTSMSSIKCSQNPTQQAGSWGQLIWWINLKALYSSSEIHDGVKIAASLLINIEIKWPKPAFPSWFHLTQNLLIFGQLRNGFLQSTLSLIQETLSYIWIYQQKTSNSTGLTFTSQQFVPTSALAAVIASLAWPPFLGFTFFKHANANKSRPPVSIFPSLCEWHPEQPFQLSLLAFGQFPETGIAFKLHLICNAVAIGNCEPHQRLCLQNLRYWLLLRS